MGIRVGVIRGNGIGPEITQATLRVLEATDIEFEWVPVAIGDEGVEQYGHPLPQESVVDTLRTAMEIMEAESRGAKAAKTE